MDLAIPHLDRVIPGSLVNLRDPFPLDPIMVTAIIDELLKCLHEPYAYPNLQRVGKFGILECRLLRENCHY